MLLYCFSLKEFNQFTQLLTLPVNCIKGSAKLIIECYIQCFLILSSIILTKKMVKMENFDNFDKADSKIIVDALEFIQKTIQERYKKLRLKLVSN